MKTLVGVFPGLLLIALLLLLSCRPGESGAETPKTAPGKPTAASKTAGETEWANVLEAARKEGSVSLYNTAWPSSVRAALSQAFKDKFGISLEFSPFSRGAELMAKVQEEKRAGLYIADVFGAGGTTLIASMKPASLLGHFEPILLLPEVTDAKRWTGEKVPFLDKDKLAVGMLANIERNIVYNTDLVKGGDITAFKDLLKPQYKGKITLNDPSVSGTGNAFMTFLATNLWDVEAARDFLRQLVKQQEVVIQRDHRTHVETVSRGKYAIGLAPSSQFIVEFLNARAPIDILILKEGTLVTPSAGALAVPTQFAHPNAARVFTNWLLSKDGQTVFTKSWGIPSLRIDVPTEGFIPAILAQPGEKLFVQDENTIMFQGKMLDVAKEVMGQSK
ncbi:MAG: extracellular solute-binding protein [Chloroflexi bacterium]|nr:extracellular solute-binding protein [Chloroflexota bacterium]